MAEADDILSTQRINELLARDPRVMRSPAANPTPAEVERVLGAPTFPQTRGEVSNATPLLPRERPNDPIHREVGPLISPAYQGWAIGQAGGNAYESALNSDIPATLGYSALAAATAAGKAAPIGAAPVGMAGVVGPFGLRNLARLYPKEIPPAVRRAQAMNREGASLMEIYKRSREDLQDTDVTSLQPAPGTSPNAIFGEVSDAPLWFTGLQNLARVQKNELEALRRDNPEAAKEGVSALRMRQIGALSHPAAMFHHPILDAAQPGRYDKTTFTAAMMDNPEFPGTPYFSGRTMADYNKQGYPTGRVRSVDVVASSPQLLARTAAHEGVHLEAHGERGMIPLGGNPSMVIASVFPEEWREAMQALEKRYGRPPTDKERSRLMYEFSRPHSTPPSKNDIAIQNALDLGYIAMPGELIANHAMDVAHKTTGQLRDMDRPMLLRRYETPEIIAGMSGGRNWPGGYFPRMYESILDPMPIATQRAANEAYMKRIEAGRSEFAAKDAAAEAEARKLEEAAIWRQAHEQLARQRGK